MADKSLFNRLKRLFSTNVVIRNVGGKQLKVTDTERIQSFSDLNTNFLKSRGLAGFHSTVGRYGYNELATISMQRLVLFRDYDLMESDPIIACLHGDTKVSTLKGFYTMKELSEMYPNGENFEVWSWDKESCKYTIGQAHHPRKTGTKKVIKLLFDNGQYLECTEDHRIMMIDGTYKEAGKLKVGDSIMPFYYKNKEYMMISDRHGKYKKAHRYIYEDILNIDVSKKHIHHINHNKYDNETSNLIEMLPEDHMKYHGISNVTSGKKQSSWTSKMKTAASNRMSDLWKKDKYKELFLLGFKEFQKRHDYKELISKYTTERWKNANEIEKEGMLKGLRKWQTSEEGKKFMSEHASKINKKRWETDIEYVAKMAKIFSNKMKELWENKEWREYKRKLHSETMRLKYANDPKYAEKTKCIGEANGKFNKEITNEFILSEGIKYNTLKDFAKELNLESCKTINSKAQFITRRLKSLGYKNFNDYKDNFVYQNHKLVKIIDENKIVDVYDLTVDFYENFALQCGIIVSNSALDIYADESSVKNEFGDVLTIKTDDDKIKSVLHNLFYDILNIEFNIWPWMRTLCKYGDHFLKLEISENYGIVNVIPVSPYEMTREEGFDPENPFRVKFKHEGLLAGQLEYENYEIAHFRLANDPNFLPYGKSMIEPARRVWKQLQLMEDAMLIHRIMRAPEKRIFKIFTGNIPPNEVEQYIKSIVNKIKKVPYVDPKTGEYNLKYNMMNMTEDFFIPVRDGDTGTTIESLPGLEYNAIEDIEYLRNKMMSALKIPKAFLGYEEGITGKATLAAEDVRFARTIERIQKIFVSELSKIAVIHLYTQGFKEEDIVNFELSLTNPSTIYEQEKISLWQEKINLVRDMQDVKMLSNDWIYKNILNLSQDEIQNEKNNVIDDIKNKFRQSQIENEGNDPYITNQTFGTPHDLAMMYKGLRQGEKKNIDFGTTNFKINWDDSTGKDEKLKTDDRNYDKNYNETQRKEPKSKYGQDSHVRGRDPLGAKEYATSINKNTRKTNVNRLSNISMESLKSMLNKIKTKELIKESLDSANENKDKIDSDKKTYLDENNLLEL